MLCAAEVTRAPATAITAAQLVHDAQISCVNTCAWSFSLCTTRLDHGSKLRLHQPAIYSRCPASSKAAVFKAFQKPAGKAARRPHVLPAPSQTAWLSAHACCTLRLLTSQTSARLLPHAAADTHPPAAMTKSACCASQHHRCLRPFDVNKAARVSSNPRRPL
jgi:hypothetical protein